MTLPAIFQSFAEPLLAAEPKLKFQWRTSKDGSTRYLTIPKQDESGFTVEVEAYTYGLYVLAEGWHSIAWDLVETADTPEGLCEEFMGFVRTLLSTEANLEVHYAGRWPYKWTMNYAVEGGKGQESTGVLFFNYFGKRSVEILQNRHLPCRYKEST